MDEHGRFADNNETTVFEENAELLTPQTADEMLAQPESKSVKRSSDTKRGKPDQKTKPEVSGGSKAKKKSSKSGKAAEKEADKQLSEDAGKTALESKTSDPGQTAKKKAARSKKTSDNETSGKSRGKKNISERLASELTDEKPPSPGKRTAKKSVQSDEEQPAEQPEADDVAARASCKTPQVMKLIEDDNDELVIYAGKSRVPKLLRGRESLSRLSRRSAAENETEVVNITELVIKHEAADILDRFNACSCDTCVEVFSELIAQRIPVRYARISRSELEMNGLPERAVPMRKIVLPEMIRELICNKKRSFHDK